jgi:sulfite reductase beta subunit-like hemoprotein
MDINKLLKALDDDSNETLLNFTTDKIRDMNFKILKELHLPKKETIDIYNKLKDYKYVDEMNELKYGTFIRWIPIEDPNNIHLTKGALFCEMKITDESVICVCKNFGYSARHFRISLDKNLIFQKLTDQELVLLSALDHLSK